MTLLKSIFPCYSKIGSVGLKPTEELDKNVRIPPLWPPNVKIGEKDRENAEKENAGTAGTNLEINDNTTEEATD